MPFTDENYSSGLDALKAFRQEQSGNGSKQQQEPETFSSGLDALKSFKQPKVEEPKVEKPQTYLTAMKPGTVVHRMPPPKFTGNYAEEVMAQFMGGVTNGLTFGLAELAGTTPVNQGTVGGTIGKVAGNVVGAIPSMIGVPGVRQFSQLSRAGQITGTGSTPFIPGLISDGLKLVTKNLAPQTRRLIANLVRLGFSEEIVRNGLNNSIEFYQALKTGDTVAIGEAATPLVLDLAFAYAMGKGFVEDAKTLRNLKAKYEAERFARARNITPEQPKQLPPASTLAEATAQAKAPEPPPIDIVAEPSSELRSVVDAKDLTETTAKKVSKAKTKYKPEVVEKGMLAQPTPEKPLEDVEPEVRLESKQPKPISDVEITLAKMDAIEKYFGKPIDEIPDDEIEKYFLGEAQPGELPEQPKQYSDEEIEAYFGKKIEDISDAEFDQFFGLTEEPAPENVAKITDVDIATGEPEPVQLDGEETVFDASKEAVQERARLYEGNNVIAPDIDTLLYSKMTEPKDVAATAWKLTNDINRWKYGEDVDIESTRNFLSEIAARADEFKGQFLNSRDHMEWKEVVQEMATWARRVERPKVKPKPVGRSTKLYSGLDPFEVAKEVSRWYSKLMQVAREKLPRIAPAEQIANTLRKVVSSDEWKRSKLDELLVPGTRVDKDRVLEQIGRNLPRFEDVLLSSKLTPNPDEYERLRGQFKIDTNAGLEGGPNTFYQIVRNGVRGSIYSTTESALDAIDRIITQELHNDETKFSTYQEPGGTDYKELFVTAPYNRDEILSNDKRYVDWLQKNFRRDNLTNRSKFESETGIQLIYGWSDGHADYADIENPIVRLRFNTRTDSEGNKVLFIEELQPPVPSEQQKMPEEFRKRWREIGMKRAVKYAVDNGFDKVAWTTGEMQVKRYPGIGGRLSEISYAKNQDGNYWIGSISPEGDLLRTDIVSPKDLDVFGGRDLANKIRNNEGKIDEENGTRTIDARDIVVGSPGLRKLYDQDIPNVARKIGGKVEDINLGFEAITYDREGMADSRNYKSVQSISLSPFKPRWTPTLYSGLDITELIKAIAPRARVAKEFFDEFRRTSGMKGIDLAKLIKHIKADVTMALVDQQEPLLKLIREKYPEDSQRIVDRQRSAASGRGYGAALYEQAAKDIYGGVSNKVVDAIHAYVLAKRLGDIYSYKPKYKSQPGYGPDQVNEAVSVIEMLQDLDEGAFKVLKRKIPAIESIFGDLTPAELAEAVKRGNIFFNWTKKIVDDLVAWGLKSEEEGKKLKAHDYRKIKSFNIEDIYDLEYGIRLGNETIRMTNSGVVSLGKGSTKIIDPDSRISLHEQMVRVYGSIANQAAKLQWRDLALEHPDNGIVMVSSKYGIPKDWRPVQIHGKKMYVSPKLLAEIAPLSQRVSKGVVSVLESFYDKFPDTQYIKTPGPVPPSDWSRMPFFEEGIEKTLYFHPDAAKHLVTRSHDITKRLAQVLRIATLAPVTRSLAVGTSPVWSTFIGLPMDIVHTFWAARTFEPTKTGLKLKSSYPFVEVTKGRYKMVYSAFDPVAQLKLGYDMAATLKDVYKRGPFFMNLMKHGLHMPFLAMRQGKFIKGALPPGDFAKFMDLLSYHGTSMEMWLRAAVAHRVVGNLAKKKGISFQAALKDDDIMYEAVHAARDRMDYNQGGWFVKALDQSGIIFLNAGVLGSRTYWRSARDNPVEFAFGSLKVALAAAGLAYAAWALYEDVTKDIPDEGNEKNVTFPLFPNFISFKDKNGDTRHFYIKMRMDPNAAFLYKTFDAITRTYLYDRGLTRQEPDYAKLVKNLKQLGPTGISMWPDVQAFYDYVTNYSWWKERQMYTQLEGRTLSWPASQYEGAEDANVSQLAKDVAKVTKLSPKRLEGAASNVIPTNNEFVYLFGKAFEEAFSDVPEDAKKDHWLMTLAEIPGVNRIIGVTQPDYQRRKAAERIEKEVTVENLIRDNKFERIAREQIWDKKFPDTDTDKLTPEQIKTNQALLKGSIGKVVEFIKGEYEAGMDEDIGDSMVNKLRFMIETRNLPHRSLWLSLLHMNPEVKAKELLDTLSKSSEVERGRIVDELNKVVNVTGSGYDSDRFIREMGRYIKEKDLSPKRLFGIPVTPEPAQVQ